MNKYSVLILLIFISLGLCACATTPYPLLVQTTQNTASELKSYCEINGIESSGTKEGYKLIIAGTKKLNADRAEAAYVDFDLAVLTYRLAIAEHQLEQSQERLKQSEAALAEAHKELDVYQKELKKLKLPMVESNL
ncbi:MAG: hypothetical protein JRG97_00050 [Deltaproteobacteria bacterium]|nr:hypothetical protein [Deltaproteobacteria bacterium]MBW2052430.1 hypothetical protein [Deltaproteobacteria bacterium]MBW2139446.1 hypothetical protein [Deltaproteobacteria bacterium]MBW2324425.1 hypothetical protein [Deltaproteobacteria bacterium]